MDIIISNYFDEKDKRELHDIFSQLRPSIIKEKKREPNTGGLIWYGIVFFLGEYVVTKFLDFLVDLSKEKIKQLFEEKNKLRPENIERFTFNIPFSNGMVFMDFTHIKTNKDFEHAIRTVKKAYYNNEKTFIASGGYYNLIYDINKKVWVVSKNKLFEI